MENVSKAIAKSDESGEAAKTITDARKYWDGRRRAEAMMGVSEMSEADES